MATPPTGRRGNRVADGLGEGERVLKRPPGDDGASDPRRVARLPVLPEQRGEAVLGIGVHDVGGGDALAPVHAHVEGAGLAVAEPPIGAIELRGADSEVEEDGGDREWSQRTSGGPGHLGADGVEAGVDDEGASVRDVPGQPVTGLGDGVEIPIETEHPQARMGVEQAALWPHRRRWRPPAAPPGRRRGR